jgi:glyoxylase-like metal-dependent hydrolase (beta-lactamase superfamily II)
MGAFLAGWRVHVRRGAEATMGEENASLMSGTGFRWQPIRPVASGREKYFGRNGERTKWDAKLRNIYGFAEGDPYRDSLANAGVKPEEIDMVINTHLHFDHAGGNTRLVDGRLTPTFPNAKYVVQRAELSTRCVRRSGTGRATTLA